MSAFIATTITAVTVKMPSIPFAIIGKVSINREKASQYGLTTSAIATTLSTAVNGSTATTYKVSSDDEIDVVIKADDTVVNYVSDLQKVTIPTSRGIIPITDVVDIVTDEGATSITRENNQRYITVGTNLNGVSLVDAV